MAREAIKPAGGEGRRTGSAAQEGAAVATGVVSVVRSAHGARVCKSIEAQFGQKPKIVTQQAALRLD